MAIYSGPVCEAWQLGSDVLCEHESCWAVMTDGGNYAFFAAYDSMMSQDVAQAGLGAARHGGVRQAVARWGKAWTRRP